MDYYNILGVSENASPEEIKKAYRTKAKLFHPDVSGDVSSAEQFKKINEAYQVLSDTDKRFQYDHGSSLPWAIFNSGRKQVHKKGKDIYVKLDIDLEDVVKYGARRDVTFSTFVLCKECKGNGLKPNCSSKKCFSCGGKGAKIISDTRGNVFFQTVLTCDNCNGTGKIIEDQDRCQNCEGHGVVEVERTANVEIPQGCDTGMNLIYRGEGHCVPNGLPGDLVVMLFVVKHPLFVRRGNDLELELPISLSEAFFGKKIGIPTIYGEVIEIDVLPGTQTNTIISKPNFGCPFMGISARGNLLVRIIVKTPVFDNKVGDVLMQLDKVVDPEQYRDSMNRYIRSRHVQ